MTHTTSQRDLFLEKMTGIRKVFFVLALITLASHCDGACQNDDVAFGLQLFQTTRLSADGETGCATCHDPAQHFTTNRPVAVGVRGARGTRNAPSLLSVSLNSTFFWDGRRSSLDESVTDAFTNPVELGLSTFGELISKINQLKLTPRKSAPHTLEQIAHDLTCYLRSLKSTTSKFDGYMDGKLSLTRSEQNGLNLFRETAGCAACHRMDSKPAVFTDDQYHHSGVQQDALERQMGLIASEVIKSNLPRDHVGAKVLSDRLWSATGRFAVTHEPKDMGSFRTPTLRNVADTAPYMHDGSIATLRDAVDREIYYRAFSTGKIVNLTDRERQDIVAFLGTLSSVTEPAHDFSNSSSQEKSLRSSATISKQH